ncbi:glycosyltransferase family 2 protein [Geobacter sp.]|uniref:glycosyltransferase family 2 protein n=1 Tax=Geobacter sp. TaxID=46610 RepID=UPI0026194EB6|nr:glycosyltransferase family 2 protein [Geobacter sp.]
MKVSLVLATVGRTAEVGRCLQSLVTQTDAIFEVVLVDQNRDDRLRPIVEASLEAGLPLRHLRMDKGNLSLARNLGILQSTGEIIGFPDDDCWYEPDTIAEIRHLFLTKTALQGVIACWVEQAVTRKKMMIIGSLSLKSWRKYRGGDASSISLFLRKDLLHLLGGFDCRLGVGQWYGAAEEIDLVLRSLSLGASMDYCPTAKVHHAFFNVPKGDRRTIYRNARNRARGTGAIYAKHRLGLWIILRGLVAPISIPLFRGKLLTAVYGFFVALGRVEGFLRWKFSEE